MPQLLGPTGGGGGGGVATVSASLPLASTGGVNPNISLFAVVPANKGGTGLSTPGALGNVLTSDGAGNWTSAAPAAGGSSTFTANCLAGDVVGASVYITGSDVGGVPQVASADASDALKTPAVGAIVSKSDATTCVVARFGRVDVSATGAVLLAGSRYFVGFNGEPVTPPPNAGLSPSGYVIVQPLGVATSATVLEYQPTQAIIRINV
jgi:hypothetical protein